MCCFELRKKDCNVEWVLEWSAGSQFERFTSCFQKIFHTIVSYRYSIILVTTDQTKLWKRWKREFLSTQIFVANTELHHTFLYSKYSWLGRHCHPTPFYWWHFENGCFAHRWNEKFLCWHTCNNVNHSTETKVPIEIYIYIYIYTYTVKSHFHLSHWLDWDRFDWMIAHPNQIYSRERQDPRESVWSSNNKDERPIVLELGGGHALDRWATERHPTIEEPSADETIASSQRHGVPSKEDDEWSYEPRRGHRNHIPPSYRRRHGRSRCRIGISEWPTMWLTHVVSDTTTDLQLCMARRWWWCWWWRRRRNWWTNGPSIVPGWTQFTFTGLLFVEPELLQVVRWSSRWIAFSLVFIRPGDDPDHVGQ